MMPSDQFADSILSIDIGSVNTRAILFDVVGTGYRMLAAGSAPSTYQAPLRDALEGVSAAIQNLEQITGRVILDSSHSLIIPTSETGDGTDHIMVTSSAGIDVRIVTMGLLEEYSMACVESLAEGTYSQVVDRFSLNDPRKPEDRLNDFIQASPDLVILAGGTNRGASRSVLKMAEQLHLWLQACQKEKRPSVLFAGNDVLKDRVHETLSSLTKVLSAPNVMPYSETEDTGSAEESLTNVLNSIRASRMAGFADLEKASGSIIMPTAGAEARIIRFESLQQDPELNVLGVNVGSSASHFISSVDGEVHTSVYRGLGAGHAAAETLKTLGLDAITRWISLDIPENLVRDYLWQKSLFPAGLPMDNETLEIEQAMARAILFEMKRRYSGMSNNLLPFSEPILVSGAVIAQAPALQQSLLMILDGLQPVGVTTILCDRFGMLPALGATASINPSLVVQVLESGVLTNLGTVISPLVNARAGEPALRVRLLEEDAPEKQYEICKGDIVRLPLAVNKPAKLVIKPLKHMDPFPGSKNLRVVGGELGVMIDLRGRPLNVSSDPETRRKNSLNWQKSLKECLG
jgi:hypothetical protein